MALVTLTFDRLIVVAWHNFWNRRTLWAFARGPIATWWTSVRASKCKIAKTEQNWASKLGIKTTHPVSWKSVISEVQAPKQTWHILDVGSDVSDPQCSKIWCSKSARLSVLKTIVLFKHFAFQVEAFKYFSKKRHEHWTQFAAFHAEVRRLATGVPARCFNQLQGCTSLSWESTCLLYHLVVATSQIQICQQLCFDSWILNDLAFRCVCCLVYTFCIVASFYLHSAPKKGVFRSNRRFYRSSKSKWSFSGVRGSAITIYRIIWDLNTLKKDNMHFHICSYICPYCFVISSQFLNVLKTHARILKFYETGMFFKS